MTSGVPRILQGGRGVSEVTLCHTRSAFQIVLWIHSMLCFCILRLLHFLFVRLAVINFQVI